MALAITLCAGITKSLVVLAGCASVHLPGVPSKSVMVVTGLPVPVSKNSQRSTLWFVYVPAFTNTLLFVIEVGRNELLGAAGVAGDVDVAVAHDV